MALAGEIAENLPGIDYILGDSRDRYSNDDVQLLETAYAFGRHAHESQRRCSGNPYFVHCIEVARLLAASRLDSPTLAAGLLHDVLEDTKTTLEELDERFPAPIPMLVEGVTKISSLDFRSSRERYTENLRKMILATAQDVRVVLIKLCDRVHNMRTLRFLPTEKQINISRDTLRIYAPLANRLGMTRIKSELEDLTMRYLYPEEYHRMSELVAEKKISRERKVEQSIQTLREHLAANGLKPEIVGRPKHFYSIFQKMKQQNLSFDQIFDLIALRVLTNSKSECYDVVGHVHSLWTPVPGKFKDYIALPKPNGYQSLHTTVIGAKGQVTEIQIRTHEMHRLAEEGIAAHWKYKEGGAPEVGLEEKLGWFRRMTDWLSEVKDPDEFMRSLTHDVFADRVFCFSPRGDVFDLPAGSTPLDFAYHVHSEVGNHCVGAKIGNRIVPLRTVLRQGDVVEIMTQKSAHPRAHWLELCKTGRARSKVRHWLRSQRREEFIEQGREKILRSARARDSEATVEKIEEAIKPLLSQFGAASVDELMADIGFGRVGVRGVVDRALGPPKPVARKTVAPKKGLPKSDIKIGGMSGTAVRFAHCCNPLPGDAVVGFVTVGRGVTVHRLNCSSLESTLRTKNLDRSRLVDATWDMEHVQPREVPIKAMARDRIGLLHDITEAISQENVSISEIRTTMSSDKTVATLRFIVEVRNKEQMNRLMAKIRNVPGVTSLTTYVR